MSCPGCQRPLREVRHHGIPVDACDCGGIWFDRGELQSWMAQKGLAGAAPGPGATALPQASLRRCPRCAVESLQRFEAGEIRGCHCGQCHGLWLTKVDVGRVERLARVDASPAGAQFGVTYGDCIAQLLAAVFDGL